MVRTAPLLVDRIDWPDLLAGAKTEWRRYGVPQAVEAPRPVLLYSLRSTGGEPERAHAILEATWREPMGAVSAESLEREGFPDDLMGFRRYIEARYPKGGYRPLAMTRVYRVRMWTPEDTEYAAKWALSTLFGDDHP